MTDFAARARRFVVAHYPQALAAFLGGSAASGDATDSSDLDILVVLPDEWASASFVETVTHEGQLVEAFSVLQGTSPARGGKQSAGVCM